MTAEDARNGWWDAPASDLWRCPECAEATSVRDWSQVDIYCEDCGDHDGRRCPHCGEDFDHVWGAQRIEAAP